MCEAAPTRDQKIEAQNWVPGGVASKNEYVTWYIKGCAQQRIINYSLDSVDIKASNSKPLNENAFISKEAWLIKNPHSKTNC